MLNTSYLANYQKSVDEGETKSSPQNIDSGCFLDKHNETKFDFDLYICQQLLRNKCEFFHATLGLTFVPRNFKIWEPGQTKW